VCLETTLSGACAVSEHVAMTHVKAETKMASMSDTSDEAALDLLPLEDSKSSVWSYSGFPSKDGVYIELEKKKRQDMYCKLCWKRISYTGNTTNLSLHLKNHHTAEYTEWQSAEKRQQAEIS